MFKTIGIIGYGQFGKFMAKHLELYCSVRAFDTKEKEGPHVAPLEEVCASDVVVFAVPSQSLEEVCIHIQPHISETTHLADVTSVKIRPMAILQKYFPRNPILGTHPIFGPQSGKDSIGGLPIVLTNISWSASTYDDVLDFLHTALQLKVVEKTADEHDREMAHVMGLAHFVGRALKNLNIRDYETSTFSYRQLIKLRDLLKYDSWELFKTIQSDNPYAADVRARLLKELNELQKQLQND